MNVVFFFLSTNDKDQLDVHAFAAGCMFSRGWHLLLVRTSISNWFTVLFMLVVIGQKLLFVHWSLRGVFFSSPGRKAMVNQYSCVCLHSDRSPQERKANLLAFKVIIVFCTREVSIKIQLHTYDAISRQTALIWSTALLCDTM